MLKGFIILATYMIATTSFASQKSICGADDDRVLSHDPKISRLSTLENCDFIFNIEKYNCE